MSTLVAALLLTLAIQKESYTIYTAMLRLKEPGVRNWAIVRHTVDFKLCIHPAPGQESIYRPMLDDYIDENQHKVDLERKFDLPNYTFVDRSEWTRSTPDRSFAVFSAVGFDPSRTRATVCLWANHSGTCYVLIKKDGTWQVDRDWHGGGCGWAA
jgi:hypothetical protein